MYIYFYYREDKPVAVAFHKANQAVEYVIGKIEEYIGVKQKKPSPAKKVRTKPSYNAAYVNVGIGDEPVEVPGQNPGEDRYVRAPQAIPMAEPNLANIPMPMPLGGDLQGNYAAEPAMPDLRTPAAMPDQYQFNVDALERLREAMYKAGPAIPKDDVPEFNAMRDQLAITHKDKSIENAKKLIETYEAYSKTILGFTSPLHTIQEIIVADENI